QPGPGCGTLTIDAKSGVKLAVGGVTYPGRITDTGFELFAPGTNVRTASGPPLYVAPLTPLPTARFVVQPDGSVTYIDVPIGGLGGPTGVSGPVLTFDPPKKDAPVITGGGGAGGGQVLIGGSGTPTSSLGSGPGMGWG